MTKDQRAKLKALIDKESWTAADYFEVRELINALLATRFTFNVGDWVYDPSGHTAGQISQIEEDRDDSNAHARIDHFTWVRLSNCARIEAPKFDIGEYVSYHYDRRKIQDVTEIYSGKLARREYRPGIGWIYSIALHNDLLRMYVTEDVLEKNLVSRSKNSPDSFCGQLSP